jgi:CheY-like chemotaxis protein
VSARPCRRDAPIPPLGRRVSLKLPNRPAYHVRDADVPAGAAAPRGAAIDEPTRSAGKVVVVDDTPELLELIQALLEDEGYEVVLCQDATRAHAVVAQEQPHLVVLDLRMAGVTEWEILDALKADAATARIPVLVCSGAADELRAAEPRLRSLGCDILLKPFEIDDLLRRVDSAIRRA